VVAFIRITHGHAVSCHDVIAKVSKPNFYLQPECLVSGVSTKTDDFTHNDNDDNLNNHYDPLLDAKDEENNKIQQEILDTFLSSKLSKGPKVAKDVQSSSILSERSNEVVYEELSSRNPLKNNDFFEYETELILFEERNISSQLTILEQNIRDLDEKSVNSDLLNSWFELVSKKNIVFHRRLMLEILQNEQDLERKCSLLQAELRSPKISPIREELLLKELLRVVDLRDKLLMDKQDEENLLCQEETIGRQIQTDIFCKSKKETCKVQ